MDVFDVAGNAPTQALVPEQYREATTPRAVVVIDGHRYIPMSYELELNAHGSTDLAHVVLPVGGSDSYGNTKNDDFTVTLFRNYNDTAPVLIQIYAGFPERPVDNSPDISQLQLRFSGIVDSYEFRADADTYTVSFHCRSLAAPLVDNQVTITSTSITSVQFLEEQATLNGLTTNIRLRSGQNAITLQEVFAREFIQGQSKYSAAIYNERAIDVLNKCAQFDDVDLWLEPQGVLNYQAPELVTRNTLDLKFGRDFTTFSGVHSPQSSKNIVVNVHSYQKRTRTSTTYRVETGVGANGGIVSTPSTKTVVLNPQFGTPTVNSQSTDASGNVTNTTSTGSGGTVNGLADDGAGESNKLKYDIYEPNLTPENARKKALALWRQYSMNEYTVTIEMPVTKAKFPGTATYSITSPGSSSSTTGTGQTGLFITSLLRVHGSPYQQFDRKYWPRRITEIFEPLSSGWRWEIEASSTVMPSGEV